jgi:hypothetical protein
MSGLLLEMVLSVCICWFLDLFLLILAYVHTGVLYLTVPLCSCICCSVAVHSLYHGFLDTFLCQYWACWYDVYCLIKLVAERAFAICLLSLLLLLLLLLLLR